MTDWAKRLKAWQTKHKEAWAKALLSDPEPTTIPKVIKSEGVYLIMGGRRKGKTALAMEIMDTMHRRKGLPGAVVYPQNPQRLQALLPAWVKVVTRVQDLPGECACVVDEASQVAHARRTSSKEAVEMDRLVAVSQQKQQLILFLTHHSRKFDVNDVQASDMIIWKQPTLADTMWERDELQIYTLRAWEYFEDFYPKGWTPLQPIPRKVLRTSYAMDLRRMAFYTMENTLPPWWSTDLSSVFKLFDNGSGNGRKTKKGESKRK